MYDIVIISGMFYQCIVFGLVEYGRAGLYRADKAKEGEDCEYNSRIWCISEKYL